jgi:hypothetical protein
MDAKLSIFFVVYPKFPNPLSLKDDVVVQKPAGSPPKLRIRQIHLTLPHPAPTPRP